MWLSEEFTAIDGIKRDKWLTGAINNKWIVEKEEEAMGAKRL